MSFSETAFPQAKGHIKGRYQLSRRMGQSLEHIFISASVGTEFTFKYQKPNKHRALQAGSGC